MTKFENEDDTGFKAVVGELRRWVKELVKSENARMLKLETEGLYKRSTSEESGGRTSGQHILRITQSGSQFGPTTVTGGLLFQGNHVGRGDDTS